MRTTISALMIMTTICSKHPVPLIYTDKHNHHHPPIEYFHHQLLPYAETPERIRQIFARLTQTNLIEPVKVDEPISHEILCAVHDEGMVQALERTSRNAADLLADTTSYYQAQISEDTYLYPSVFQVRSAMQRLRDVNPAGYYAFDVFAPIGHGTWCAVCHSAAVADTGAKRVIDGAPLVYALCRPPGHHAGHDFIGGYCYINNAAIAAHRLLARGRVAIIDLDYHHGNGTQSIFWDNPDVFFGSIHADPAHEYPYYAGYADETGGPNAPDTNLNLPLPLNSDAATYHHALVRLLDAVRAFDPATLVISLGFDTFIDDHLCAFNLTAGDYAQIGTLLTQLDRPTLLVQEGGYNVAAGGSLAEQVISGFVGLPIESAAGDGIYSHT